jgi:tRNA A-37 threonylcarbamoyl transferase component Bud32
MGTVYLAEHTFMGWRAAVKVLRRSLADDKVLVKRFINEAHAVKAVRHPNIIDIIDVGVLSDGLPYLLMELLEGDSLAARLHRSGRLALEDALEIARQTAAALGAAHDKGIVHRDLKPDNLFLVRDPEHPAREKVKVLDFGIAKLRGGAPHGSSANTRSGVLLGTPAYMSPEQCRGIGDEVDHRTDIYALSIILHQMLVGKAPFASAGTGDVLIMHVSAPPPPVRTENPSVPQAIEDAILRGLAKRREQRFQTMAELTAALGGWVGRAACSHPSHRRAGGRDPAQLADGDHPRVAGVPPLGAHAGAGGAGGGRAGAGDPDRDPHRARSRAGAGLRHRAGFRLPHRPRPGSHGRRRQKERLRAPGSAPRGPAGRDGTERVPPHGATARGRCRAERVRACCDAGGPGQGRPRPTPGAPAPGVPSLAGRARARDQDRDGRAAHPDDPTPQETSEALA